MRMRRKSRKNKKEARCGNACANPHRASAVSYQEIEENSPDTQPTCPLTTTACQPFFAVATHSKEAPLLAAVMRLYFVSLPARMLTVPLLQMMVTFFGAAEGISGVSGACSVQGYRLYYKSTTQIKFILPKGD